MGSGTVTDCLYSVVSQFGADAFTQYFIQDGVRIDVPAPTFDGISDTSDITDDFCTNQFSVFDERDRYAEVGGWTAMQEAINIPMVLVMSIWNDVSPRNARFGTRLCRDC
jgi:cellulose 1,4-beta-cellobiosidase